MKALFDILEAGKAQMQKQATEAREGTRKPGNFKTEYTASRPNYCARCSKMDRIGYCAPGRGATCEACYWAERGDRERREMQRFEPASQGDFKRADDVQGPHVDVFKGRAGDNEDRWRKWAE